MPSNNRSLFNLYAQHKSQNLVTPLQCVQDCGCLSVNSLIREIQGIVMNYGEKHYCNKSHCPHPKNLHCNQFCITCSRTIGPHPILDIRSEFVAATKKEIASQKRLPERFRPQLCYGYLPGRLRDTAENYRDPSLYPYYHSHSDYWSNSRQLQNESGQVLGYYKYTLVKQPGESSGSWGKLFWLMIIGVIIWFWFFR